MNVINQAIGEKYAMYHGDCCSVIKAFRKIPSDISFFLRRSPAYIHIQTTTRIWATVLATMSFINILSI